MPDMHSSHNLLENRLPGQDYQHSSVGARGSQSYGAAATGATSNGNTHPFTDDTEGALAALPGPGKLKQMTKQRAADDGDSGFIGSMVGSGVGEPPAFIQQREEQEREQALRLRHQANER